MSDTPTESRQKRSFLKLALVSVALIGVAALLYVMLKASVQPKADADIVSFRTGALEKLRVPGTPIPRNPRYPEIDMGVSPAAAPAPDIAFRDASGKSVKISDFKGQVVLVNLWATWCAPCKVEMPTLAKLQAAYAAQPVQVMALSIDVPEKEAEAAAFIAKHSPLKIYYAGGSGAMFQFQPAAQNVPATIIYDRKGIERARLEGDADWSGKEARALVERLLAEKG